MIKAGQSLYYVTGGGGIHPVTAVSDEKAGLVKIRQANGREEDMGTLHLFGSATAAHEAAHRRKNNKPSSPDFIKRGQ